MKVGVLASGNLGYNILGKISQAHKLSFVMTDHSSQLIISFCETYRIPIFVGNPRIGKTDDFLSQVSCEVLISINYIFLIEQRLIEFPKILAFNIHGSLLPKYRGRTPHVWSIINNEKVTGITAHLIDSGCDTGNVIEQVQIKIENDDTGASMLKKFESEYYTLVTSVLNKISNSQLKTYPQENTKATYFGKRTPEDGLIDWSWHRERIYNWVRAQSFPYPGAYTFYFKKKLVIDWIEFDDYGFDYNIQNGTIVSIDPIRVKTPNGLVRITKLRSDISYFNVNTKFENL